jgi:hypothetical protein
MHAANGTHDAGRSTKRVRQGECMGDDALPAAIMGYRFGISRVLMKGMLILFLSLI